MQYKKEKCRIEIEEAIKNIQNILVKDMRIPITAAKEINDNLKKIQERIKH